MYIDICIQSYAVESMERDEVGLTGVSSGWFYQTKYTSCYSPFRQYWGGISRKRGYVDVWGRRRHGNCGNYR